VTFSTYAPSSVRWRSAFVAIAVLTALVGVRSPVAAAVNPGRLVPVVVQAVRGASDVERTIATFGGRVTRRIGIIDGYAAQVPEHLVDGLRSATGIASVTADDSLHLLSDGYSPSDDPYGLYQTEQDLGARAMWAKHYTGAGIDIALIDSGVTPVPGLAGTGKIITGPDLTEESQNSATASLDTYGHGTFMAGIIAGHDGNVDPSSSSGGSSNAFMGLAPNARIVSVKVADAHGATDVSQVLAGIDWVVQHAQDPGMNIRVLNLSFGTDSAQPYNIDPLAYAAEVAWNHGIFVVVSAGNNGAADGRLTDPAIDPFVLAVGADDTNSTASPADDVIPSFSSLGDGVRNPDVVMPGVHMQSLRVPGSFIDTQYGSTGKINNRYFRGSGTSEAAAAASGTVALLMSAAPNATNDQIKAVLKQTASPIPGADPNAQGSGLVTLRNMATAHPPTPVNAVQNFVPSTGTGSLDASRGSSSLELNGVVLSGEQDIFGTPVDTTALAAQEAAGTAWTGGVWNGVRWSGDNWQGVRWSGAVWDGNDWSGVRWSSENWSTGNWDGVRWSNANWNGSTWDGVRWSGMRWSGMRWSGDTWSNGEWI